MALTANQIWTLTIGEMFGYDKPTQAQPWLQARVLADLNAVRQTLFLNDPEKTLIKVRKAVVLNAPAIIQVGVTNGSQTITGAGLATWMDGCTINVGGDTNQNRLLYTGSGYLLEAPYTEGATGTVTATIYNDAITLPGNAISVERPIDIENQAELMPFLNQANMRGSCWGLSYNYTDYGRLTYDVRPGGYPSLALPRQSATPLAYIMEAAQLYAAGSLTGGVVYRIRVDPLPDVNYVLRWWQRTLPAAITSSTDTTSVLTPAGMDESIFMPMLAARLSDVGLFTGDYNRKQAAGVRAKKDLDSMASPQPMRDWNCDFSAGF